MEYTKENFRGLHYNVYELPLDKDPRHEWPELLKYPEFKKNLTNAKIIGNFNEVFRYIVYMYDKNSPLIHITDIYKRKSKAAELAGFQLSGKIGKKKFSPFVVDVINCEDNDTNNMIIRMCMLQRSDKFALLIVGYENLYNTLRELVDADDDKTKDTKDKQAIFKETISHTNQLEKLRFEVLNKDPNSYIDRDLYGHIAEEVERKLMISPEDYAFARR
jgi:hypothetical protein